MSHTTESIATAGQYSYLMLRMSAEFRGILLLLKVVGVWAGAVLVMVALDSLNLDLRLCHRVLVRPALLSIAAARCQPILLHLQHRCLLNVSRSSLETAEHGSFG